MGETYKSILSINKVTDLKKKVLLTLNVFKKPFGRVVLFLPFFFLFFIFLNLYVCVVYVCDVCVYICMYICICVYVYVCIYVYVHIHVCIYKGNEEFIVFCVCIIVL